MEWLGMQRDHALELGVYNMISNEHDEDYKSCLR
jgi:hypothetical protein